MSLVPDVNPAVTEVEEGGTGYRYYLLAAADGKTPVTCASVSIRLSGGSTISQVENPSDDWAGRVAGVPDADGIVRLRIPSGVLTPVNTPRTIEVLVDGIVRTTFTAKRVPREYEHVWKHNTGEGVSGKIKIVRLGLEELYESTVRHQVIGGVVQGETIERRKETKFKAGVEAGGGLKVGRIVNNGKKYGGGGYIAWNLGSEYSF